MMDDVLISNLPTPLLRSALRSLISQGASTQKPFVDHVRKQLEASPMGFPKPEVLFPGSLASPTGTKVSPECENYLALVRCLFTSKLVEESLIYLTHFASSIPAGKTRWTSGDGLQDALEAYDGDVVQAVQALKELDPPKTAELEGSLQALLSSLSQCRAYCETADPALPFPLTRSERQLQDVLRLFYPASDLTTSLEHPQQAVGFSFSEIAGKAETFQVGPSRMPRLFNGLWQLSSPAWGSATAENQYDALLRLVKNGLVAFDMADHYGDAELVFGHFRNSLPETVRARVYAATKWCVFRPIQRPVSEEWVLSAVQERCRRLGGRVELLQFHWYDYSAKEYLDVLVELAKIARDRPNLVSAIGLCNFDSEHTEEACRYLVERTGSPSLVSNQVQFSLVDARPLEKMVEVCKKYNLQLLTYGSFCGGFISRKWLGQPAPQLYAQGARLTPSQRKYFDMIQSWGSWAEFQELLGVLDSIALKHGLSLTNIATRWVLQQPAVGAVIVGTRLGVSSHEDENSKVFGFNLTSEEIDSINDVALGAHGQKAKALFAKLGDCGHEYRKMH